MLIELTSSEITGLNLRRISLKGEISKKQSTQNINIFNVITIFEPINGMGGERKEVIKKKQCKNVRKRKLNDPREIS